MKSKLSIVIISLLLVFLVSCGSRQYKDPHGNTYKYKLTLTGTMPNAKTESKFVILSNDNNLTFDDVAKSLYSSNSNDSLDIYIISSE